MNPIRGIGHPSESRTSTERSELGERSATPRHAVGEVLKSSVSVQGWGYHALWGYIGDLFAVTGRLFFRRLGLHRPLGLMAVQVLADELGTSLFTSRLRTGDRDPLARYTFEVEQGLATRLILIGGISCLGRLGFAATGLRGFAIQMVLLGFGNLLAGEVTRLSGSKEATVPWTTSGLLMSLCGAGILMGRGRVIHRVQRNTFDMERFVKAVEERIGHPERYRRGTPGPIIAFSRKRPRTTGRHSLVRRGGSEPPAEPPRPIELTELGRQVVERLRGHLLQRVAGHRHRHSPTAPPMRNEVDVPVAIDLRTGRILEEGEGHADIVALRMTIHPMANRVEVDGESRSALDEAFRREEDPVRREVLAGIVQFLRNPQLVISAERLALEARAGDQGVLPPADPEVVAANLDLLSGKGGGSRQAMTVAFGQTVNWLHGFRVGTLSLDGSGRIVGKAIAMPADLTARGTVYTTGVASAGDTVQVVLYHDRLVWFRELDILSDTQLAVLHAMRGREGLVEMQRHAPGGLNRILAGQGWPTVDLAGLPQVRPSPAYLWSRFGDTPELGYACDDPDRGNRILRKAIGFGGLEAAEVTEARFSSLLAQEFDRLYDRVVARGTLKPLFPRALRQVILLTQRARGLGYPVEIDTRRWEEARREVGLADFETSWETRALHTVDKTGDDPEARLILLAFSGDIDVDLRANGLREVSVGRWSANAFRLDDEYLSGCHFSLRLDGDTWRMRLVAEHGSLYRNYDEVEGEVPVSDGDVIGTGRLQWVVRIPPPKPASVAEPSPRTGQTIPFPPPLTPPTRETLPFPPPFRKPT